MPPPDHLIIKRRAQEEDRMTYEKVCRDNFKAASTAEWEIKTQGTIEHNVGNIRYNAIRQADAQLLNERRRKLAGMLEAESEAFQQQLEALEESPAQRKARMEARAGQLKDKREAEVRRLKAASGRSPRGANRPLRSPASTAPLLRGAASGRRARLPPRGGARAHTEASRSCPLASRSGARLCGSSTSGSGAWRATRCERRSRRRS
jgi:hypothetical protein